MTALYALLVGIDAYDESVGRLRGCRNDIDRVWEYLTDPRSAPEQLFELRLYDEQATRAAIVAGFRTHLGRAGDGDTALFWFSGHGSLVPVPPRLARLEPSGTMQTIVCVDSRRGTVPDLLDKELAILIAEVAANGAHVVIVLDCCHAKGATRDATLTRQAPPGEAPPSMERLLPELREHADNGVRGAGATVNRQPDHVALFACATDQSAYEIPLPTGSRGAFSLALLTELGRLGSAATYRELIGGARCYVENVFRQQVPVLFPSDNEIVDQPFLGGQPRPPESPIEMRFAGGGWEIDVGACHGLVAGTADDPTVVAVHGAEPLREARVDVVLPHRSTVHPVDWQPRQGRQYPVVLTSVPLPATTVAAARTPGDDQPTLAHVLAALRSAAPGGRPSPHLREIADDDPTELPDLLLTAPSPGTVRVSDPSGVPYLRDVSGVSRRSDAVRLVADLEHIARWRQVKALQNPASRLTNAVRIEVVPMVDGESAAPPGRVAMRPNSAGAIVLNYRRTAGRWIAPEVFVRLHNATDRPLYGVLLDLTDRYRIHPHLFPGDAIRPRYAAWAQEGEPIQLTLPRGRPIEPGRSGTDWLKLLVAEQPFSSAPFVLRGLEEPGPSPAARSRDAFSGVLDRLGLTAMFRDAGRRSSPAHDWTTSIITIITRVPESDAAPPG